MISRLNQLLSSTSLALRAIIGQSGHFFGHGSMVIVKSVSRFVKIHHKILVLSLNIVTG